MPDIEIISPGQSLRLDPQASGFAHGFGLFETICLRGGRLELWPAHWQRLKRSAAELGMQLTHDQGEALDAVRTLAGDLRPDALIKLSLIKEAGASRLLVYSRPLDSPPDRIGLLLDGLARIDEKSLLAGYKTHNYLENIMVTGSARAAGCYDGLRLDTKGHIAEGALSNIFFYKDDCLRTSGLESGLLPGVMREALLEVMSVKVGSYAPADLTGAEAVFLTNSSISLQPVDFLLSGGSEIKLSSKAHHCFKPARSLLAEKIKASAIEL